MRFPLTRRWTSFQSWPKGKRGLWLKLHTEQAEVVLVAINEGFNYHHAEAGYAMLTFWIPDLSSMLSSDSSHHFGVAAFLINDNKEALPPCGLLRT
ncbi:Nudix hydrolase 8, partial [Cucurbita argyrosperma subsp. argyrosperma]